MISDSSSDDILGGFGGGFTFAAFFLDFFFSEPDYRTKTTHSWADDSIWPHSETPATYNNV